MILASESASNCRARWRRSSICRARSGTPNSSRNSRLKCRSLQCSCSGQFAQRAFGQFRLQHLPDELAETIAQFVGVAAAARRRRRDRPAIALAQNCSNAQRIVSPSLRVWLAMWANFCPIGSCAVK